MKRDFDRWDLVLAAAILVAGLVLRMRLALITWLNPDEALHALMALGSWGQVFRNSLEEAHPPLFILVTHAASLVSRTDIALRIFPLVAGVLFPVLLSAWLYRVAGKTAAMAALFMLTLAPPMIAMSTQVRSYTPAFLFLAAALLVFEIALDQNRPWAMVGYTALLCLCVLSDYSAAWFVGAVGLYALLRLRAVYMDPRTRKGALRAAVVWAAGQLAVLAVYVALWEIQAKIFRIEQAGRSGWLQAEIHSMRDRAIFPFLGTLRQFTFLMASNPLGILTAALFLSAVVLLWTGRTPMERSKARALSVLLTAPFVLCTIGALTFQLPYWRSRHTLVLGVFAAAGAAIGLETLPRRIAKGLLWLALLLTPVWHWTADPDPLEIPSGRDRKDLFLQSLNYMRASIPPGTMVFTERETLFPLAWYAGNTTLPYPPYQLPVREFKVTLVGGRWPVETIDYDYATPALYRAALAEFRRHHGLSAQAPVWVLDGGWAIASGPPDETRPFMRAMRVFQE